MMKVNSEKSKVNNKLAQIILFCFLVFFSSEKSAAQNISATLKADSTHIVIGDFLNVKLTVKYPKETNVTMPSVFDTVGNMELVKSSKIDTTISGDTKTVTQIFIVSAYDSGNFHVGPLMILSKNKSGAIDTILSDYVFVSVSTVAVDTSKPIKPIKAPIDVPYSWKEFIPYIVGGIVLLLLIVVLSFYYMRRIKKNPVIIERPKPKDQAHIWARKELKILEEENIEDNEDLSEINHILKKRENVVITDEKYNNSINDLIRLDKEKIRKLELYIEENIKIINYINEINPHPLVQNILFLA